MKQYFSYSDFEYDNDNFQNFDQIDYIIIYKSTFLTHVFLL